MLPELLKDSLVAQIVVGFLIVLITILFLNAWVFGRGAASLLSSSSSSSAGGERKRTALVLIGPQHSGKTTLFQRLVAPSCVATKPTHTSMIANCAAVYPAKVIAEHSSRSEGRDEQEITDEAALKRRERILSAGSRKSFDVIDCPGHLRLYDVMLSSLRSAKVICIVVDGNRVQDAENGAGSVAALLITALSSREASGASHVVVACNKRDGVTSFSSKALQKLTEKELKQRLAQKGTAGAGVGAAGAPGEGVKKSETLTLDEDGNFDWSMCPKPVTFCDVSAKAPFGKWALDPILEHMCI